jgi:hypothetical protein
MRNTLGALTHTHGFDLNDYIDIVARHLTEYFVDLRYIILDQPTGNKFSHHKRSIIATPTTAQIRQKQCINGLVPF